MKRVVELEPRKSHVYLRQETLWYQKTKRGTMTNDDLKRTSARRSRELLRQWWVRGRGGSAGNAKKR